MPDRHVAQDAGAIRVIVATETVDELGAHLGVREPFVDVITRLDGAAIDRVVDERLAEQHNAAHKLTNVWEAFALERSELPPAAVLSGPVLVIDDVWDSGWTMTVVADLLRAAGTGPVLPFALARR